jgi:hypothetical protein
MSRERKGMNKYSIVNNEYAILYMRNKKGTYEALIDIDDLNKLIELDWSWHLAWSNTTKSYYVKTTFRFRENGKTKGKTIYLHRHLMPCSEEFYIDHKNHNTLDNRKNNLRITTNIENHENRINKPNRNSSTGCRNITYSSSEGVYYFQIWDGAHNIRVKSFSNKEEAIKYANENRYKYYKNA